MDKKQQKLGIKLDFSVIKFFLWTPGWFWYTVLENPGLEGSWLRGFYKKNSSWHLVGFYTQYLETQGRRKMTKRALSIIFSGRMVGFKRLKIKIKSLQLQLDVVSNLNFGLKNRAESISIWIIKRSYVPMFLIDLFCRTFLRKLNMKI
jgi:hypothetical protein